MEKRMLRIIVLSALLGSASFSRVFAQDLTGTWQGTVHVAATPQRPAQDFRVVYKFAKADAALKVTFYTLDQTPAPFAGSATSQGSSVKILVPSVSGTYEGKLDSDGVNLIGTWMPGNTPYPLNLKHVNEGAAWEIPRPPPPLKPMAADADPVFEVATIKPSNPDEQGRGFAIRGREFSTFNTTLSSLVVFAYGIHPAQIVGAPDWVDSVKYDLLAKPGGEGQPSQKQIKVMVQKLLGDRFQLKFHHDQKELTVFALVVGKGGPKLTPSASTNNGPGLFFRGLGNLPAANATMSDLAALLLGAVLDRPVIDQTGLSGRFDFTLNWTPDETQFASLGVRRPTPSGELPPDAPPDLFTSIQQQIGLKLETKKLPVDVFIIDRVEKPSAN